MQDININFNRYINTGKGSLYNKQLTFFKGPIIKYRNHPENTIP